MTEPQPISQDTPEPTAAPPGAVGGFSSTEKLIGAYAAYKAPFVTGIAAQELARNETDPVRRKQLQDLSRNSFLLWGAGAAVGLVVLVIVLVSFNSMSNGANGGGAAGGRCHGGPDRYAFEDITYDSTDGIHWTGTYPCVDGGSTTIPVPRGEVPGEGP